MFALRVSDYGHSQMLNICDAALLGQSLSEGKLIVHIRSQYYGEKIVDSSGAESFLRSSTIINMAGKEIVSLSTNLGIGSNKGVRLISGVPFLIVFRM